MQAQRRCWERRRRPTAVANRCRRAARSSGAPIGESVIGLCPNILRRVELRRIGGEVMNLQPRVACEECSNLTAAVDGTAVPEQVDGASPMPEQVVKERADVEASEIAGRQRR
jgi:hypothetical protein